MNFDDAGSDMVRRFFIESTLGWVLDFHIDMLRLDAVHAIFDRSADPYLRALGRSVHSVSERAGRRALLIAESDLNDPRVIQPAEIGGHGLDAQWSDDFHHALHALVTGENTGYYADFGRVADLARAYSQPYVYAGRFSRYRDRRHGSPPDGCEGRRFVVCSQNHDQVGNRAQGDRLSESLSFSQQKLLACVLLLSPYVPLLFMGQEYGETAPFQYFTNFGDADLGAAVRRGRRAEFRAFGWAEDEIPDPEDPATFERSRLSRARRETLQGKALEALHGALIALRRTHPALRNLDRRAVMTDSDEARRALIVRRDAGGDSVFAVFAFGDTVEVPLGADKEPDRVWTRLVDTEATEWGGSGATTPPRAPDGMTLSVGRHAAVVYSASEPSR